MAFFCNQNTIMDTQTTKELLNAPQRGEIILYQTADGRTKIDVKLENETVWLTQDQLVILFERDRSVISRHISNIFKEGELDPNVVRAKIATTTPHGAIPGKWQTHEVVFYNLDVIISVGYRVKSQRGTQFRIWTNSVLKDYLIKGYAVRNDLAQQKYDDLKALVPCFLVIPLFAGVNGIWLALPATEALTFLSIVSFSLFRKRQTAKR